MGDRGARGPPTRWRSRRRGFDRANVSSELMETVGRRWDRLAGLLFLALVVAAVGLLIAGYGIAVGVGALVGLALGFLAGALGALWLGRGSGRSITFGGMEWSSESGRPTAELIAEMQELGEISSIDIGPIQAVIPVLGSAESGGLNVQLVSVEIHEAGLAMTFDVASHLGTLPPASMARLVVSDDAGTTYRASAQGQGGLPGRMRYAVTAVPTPPTAATALQVRIERFFDPFPGGRSSAVGPWSFTIPLGSRGESAER